MKKLFVIVALAAISLGSVYASGVPVKNSVADTTKKVKVKAKKDGTMKKKVKAKKDTAATKM